MEISEPEADRIRARRDGSLGVRTVKQNHYPQPHDRQTRPARADGGVSGGAGRQTKDAIAGARQRLSGGFQKDQEFTDLRASLDQLVNDQPVLERKLRDAEFALADCKAWLDGFAERRRAGTGRACEA